MKYFLPFLYFFLCFFSSAQTVEKTLATINEEMISLMDLKEARQRLKRGFLEDSVLLTLFNKTQLKQKDSTLLDFLIYEKILDISITQMDLKVEPAHLKQELSNKRKKTRLSKKAFSRFLVKNRFTSSSYKSFLKKSILRRLLVQREVVEKIRFSDQDLNEYARQKEGKALFTSFEYELVYLFFPPTKEGKRQAWKNSQLISKDSTFFNKWKPEKKGEKRELLKNLKLSALHPTIKEAIKTLSTGQISPVLFLPNGHHIFKVIWKTPIITAENQKRKEKLSQLLFKELFKKRLKKWLEEKKKTSFVQIN